MTAFHKLLGPSDMMAYIVMMAPRLSEFRRALKTTGSIYLHCDSTASHYLKILMDSIFGPENFRNEIHWYYYNKMHDSRKKLFPHATDSILFYVKDVHSDFLFQQLKEQRDEPIKQLKRKKVEGKMVNAKDEEGHVMYQIKTDRTIDNVWRIPCLQPASPEKIGYPTQKPEKLLERIIMASSRPGDVVLDPFCGCGTTVMVAQRLERSWIGIDITHLAITLMRHRLGDAFGSKAVYQVIGEPVSVSDAEALAKQDPYQFQWWALGLVGARPEEEKKGADKGIDGRLYFFVERGKEEQILISVKAGNVTASYVRDLRGVVERDKASIGVLISMHESTGPMKTEAAEAGFYTSRELGNPKYPRMQLLTVEQLLNGERIKCPLSVLSKATNTTYVKAPKAKNPKKTTSNLQSFLIDH